jgi:RimJ/RimL family protein N-acetyltransferase
MSTVNLRFPEPGDAGAILEAVRESLPELCRWMAWCHAGYSEADAMHWISSQAQAREAGTAFEFLIQGDDGRLLGVCGINGVDTVNRFANLGYWVRTSEAGRGVAVKAVKLLVAWVFQHTKLERLEIVAAIGNEASQRVAERAGALREGTLRSRLCIQGTFHDAVMHSVVRPTQKAAEPRR